MDVFLGPQSVAWPDKYCAAAWPSITTVVNFARVDRLAAFCLLPLAAWVAFAGVLNTAIWLLNI
ncbi:MAG: tryptophan-rich sensory protein [Pseudolabrys sp.]